MRFLARSLSGLFLTFLTLALLFLAGFQLWQATRPDAASARREPSEQVFTARLIDIRAGQVRPVMRVFGTIQSRRRLELRAGAAGQIVSLDPAMQEGGRVGKGQVLVRIDPRAPQAAIDNQLAAEADAQASLQDARRLVQVGTDDLAAAERQSELRVAALDRQVQLAKRGLGTTSERDNAELAVSSAEQGVIAGRSALAAAQSAVSAAENALRRAGIDLSEARRALADTEITAGFAGRVTAVTAVEGGLVSLNERLAEIVDPDALEIQIALSLDQYGRLLADADGIAGRPARIVLDGTTGRLMMDAVLDRAAASVAEGMAGRTVFARVTKTATATPLRPGDFVSVEIAEPALDGAALIPATAVGSDGAVLMPDQAGRLRSMPVDVLRRQGDDVVIAVGADLDGGRIVAERAPQLGVGILVRAQDATPGATPVSDQRAANPGRAGNG